ncbi:hypothetical protein ACWDYJ_23010 [Streptomyces sp. NPDC003042]
MTFMPHRSGALLLALAASLLPVVSAAPATAVTDPVPRWYRLHTADEISRFLTAFYGHHGPSGRDRMLWTSQQLKDKQENAPASDVVLCAQNTPQDIGIGPVTVAQAAGVGWATVTTHWDSGATDTFTAYVRLDSRPIQLDDVICAG